MKKLHIETKLRCMRCISIVGFVSAHAYEVHHEYALQKNVKQHHILISKTYITLKRLN